MKRRLVRESLAGAVVPVVTGVRVAEMWVEAFALMMREWHPRPP